MAAMIGLCHHMQYSCRRRSVAANRCDAAQSLVAGECVAPSLGAGPPVYVIVADHIEHTPIYTNCDAYPDFHEMLLLIAKAIAQTRAAVNLPIEYEFFQGVPECETEALQATTDGLHIW